MKALILYSSLTAENIHSQPIMVQRNKLVWIRTEEVEAANLSDALDLAKPLGDEVVLNTIQAPN